MKYRAPDSVSRSMAPELDSSIGYVSSRFCLFKTLPMRSCCEYNRPSTVSIGELNQTEPSIGLAEVYVHEATVWSLIGMTPSFFIMNVHDLLVL